MIRSYGKLARLLGAGALAVVLAMTAVQSATTAIKFEDLLYCHDVAAAPGVPAHCAGWCLSGTCGYTNVGGVIACRC
jgi:hypothetical protein